jgi:glycerol kinase
MDFILALDQGTTSSRAIVFDRQGSIRSVAQREFRQIFPRPGWVEHDPTEIWETSVGVLGEALAGRKFDASDLAGIGITNQRETTLVWNRETGQPVYNAIVWQDRRTAEHCERLRAAGAEETFRTRTGLILDAYFSGTKIAWILDNVPGAREQAEAGKLAFGTVDSWLAYRLSNRSLHITDVSNACRTLLFNIHTGTWDDELLDLLGVPRSLLPDVRASSEVYGEVAPSLAAGGVPLAGIVGDQQAATMGQACLHPGLAKNTYGTGCFLLMNTGQEAKASDNRLLTTVAWKMRGETTYALEGSVFVGGAVVQWLRDGLGIIRTAADVEKLAASVPDSGGVVLVPALTGLGAPHWDPHARGSILGITRGTTAAHIARAALEGIAFSVVDLVRAMEADAGSPISELRVDGGAAANDLLLQIQADLLQLPVVRPTVLETTALGAAYMAGLATGFWDSTDQIEANWNMDRTFEPQCPAAEAEARREPWAEAVRRSARWASPDE